MNEVQNNPYCSGCGEPIRNGKPVAIRRRYLWHAFCAMEANAPPPFYYQERIKLS